MKNSIIAENLNTVSPIEEFVRTLNFDNFKLILSSLDHATRVMCIRRAMKAVCSPAWVTLHGLEKVNAAVEQLRAEF